VPPAGYIASLCYRHDNTPCGQDDGPQLIRSGREISLASCNTRKSDEKVRCSEASGGQSQYHIRRQSVRCCIRMLGSARTAFQISPFNFPRGLFLSRDWMSRCYLQLHLIRPGFFACRLSSPTHTADLVSISATLSRSGLGEYDG
jgi:hypothetical protein